MLDLLQIPKTTKILSPGVPIYPDNENKNNYLGDPDILGKRTFQNSEMAKSKIHVNRIKNI